MSATSASVTDGLSVVAVDGTSDAPMGLALDAAEVAFEPFWGEGTAGTPMFSVVALIVRVLSRKTCDDTAAVGWEGKMESR